MGQYFETRGYELALASELEQAEALLSNDAFDAVITDVRLTNLQQAEGLLLLGFIRERAVNTRVLVMTAYEGIDVREEAFRLGAEHFFVKPVSLEHMAAVLDRPVRSTTEVTSSARRCCSITCASRKRKCDSTASASPAHCTPRRRWISRRACTSTYTPRRSSATRSSRSSSKAPRRRPPSIRRG